MDDPELIIYIIFLAVSLLGGVWKNYKKGQAKKLNPQPAQQSMEEDDLEDTFEQQRRDQEIERAIQEEQRRLDQERFEQERTIQKAQKEEKAGTALFANQAPVRKIRRSRIQQKIETINEETTTEFNLEDFDVRKAIIYSEILNPPYL